MSDCALIRFAWASDLELRGPVVEVLKCDRSHRRRQRLERGADGFKFA